MPNSNLAADLNNGTALIRNRNVIPSLNIPSKDKSQQQHLSASTNSPNQHKSKDELIHELNSKSTKDKQQTKSSTNNFTELFGTPIKNKKFKR